MPKLLRKNIWKSIIELILLCLLAYIITGFAKIFIGEYNQKDFFLIVQEGYVFLMVIIMYSYSAFVGQTLPDYIFIAPFSLEDRKYLIKKLFTVNILTNFLCPSIFFIVPVFINFFRYRNSQILAGCLFQEIILFGIVYAFSYLKYFRERNVAGELGIIAVSTIWESILAGIIEEMGEFVLQENMLLKFIIIAVILNIFLIVYYHIKHFKAMVDYYAEYEIRNCQG